MKTTFHLSNYTGAATKLPKTKLQSLSLTPKYRAEQFPNKFCGLDQVVSYRYILI